MKTLPSYLLDNRDFSDPHNHQNENRINVLIRNPIPLTEEAVEDARWRLNIEQLVGSTIVRLVRHV